MRWLAVLVASSACGDQATTPDSAVNDVVDAPIDGGLPTTLADTGLCVDPACAQIRTGVLPYRPRFELWSDTALKRRWIALPAGTRIDTSDMDHWQFPAGTKLWKEFSRNGVRVETRLVMRIGPGDSVDDWFYATYVWNAAQDAAVAAPNGAFDANGTPHDVPAEAQCRACHENLKPSRVLGFGAIQLDADDPSELDLGDLVAMGLLTHPPAGARPFFPLPTEGTSTARPALGYLHANCGHCHNPTSMVFAVDTPVVLRLDVDRLGTLAETPAYTTSVNVAGDPAGGRTTLAVPGLPDESIMVYRFESMVANERMPAVGTEDMDPDGAALLRAWIANL